MNSLPTPEPESGRQHLVRALGELPTPEPAPATWDAILAQLASEQALASALPQLPSHEPAADTWQQVAARLDQLAAPTAPRPPHRQRRTWQLGLAASLLLLLVAGLAWLGRPAGAPPVIASMPPAARPLAAVPAMPALPPPPAADQLEAQGEAFIEAHCTSLPQVCQSGEFRQLRAQLADLQQQEQQLRAQTQRRGTTPQLVQQQVQVTIRKATVTRELIQLLIS